MVYSTDATNHHDYTRHFATIVCSIISELRMLEWNMDVIYYFILEEAADTNDQIELFGKSTSIIEPNE